VHRTAHREGVDRPQDRRVLYQLLALAAAFLYPLRSGGRNSIRTLSVWSVGFFVTVC